MHKIIPNDDAFWRIIAKSWTADERVQLCKLAEALT